jgi:hypothetical protein
MFSYRARKQRVYDTGPVVSTLLSSVDCLVIPEATFKYAFPKVLCVLAVSGNYVGQKLSWKAGK